MTKQSDLISRFSTLPTGWHCYLLECADHSYYCGVTSNLSHRMLHHSTGKGSSYTKEIRPAALVWIEPHDNEQNARLRESQIKGWSRAKKHSLAKGLPPFNALGQPARVPLV